MSGRLSRRGERALAACPARLPQLLVPVCHLCRKSCIRREGMPAWIQVVEPRLEQAAETGERRLPAAGKSGTSGREHPQSPGKSRNPPSRHSGAGRNPVVYCIHSRIAGMTITGRQPNAPSTKTCHSFTTAPPPSSAACSRRGSTTYIPVGVDSSLRWNDDGVGIGLSPS